MNFLNFLTDTQQPTGSGLTSLFMIAIMFGLLYFVMIRPEKKRNKQMQEMRNALIVGDKITTNAGIVGTVVNIKDDEVTIETGIDGTKILIKKWAISTVDTIKE